MMTIVLSFLKKHWQVIALVAVLGAGYAWFRHQQASYAKTISDLSASHQVALDQINAAKALEDQQHAQELKDLQDRSAKIESDYAAAQAELQAQTTQEQEQIVQRFGNDADGLAQLLAGKFGFIVVKP